MYNEMAGLKNEQNSFSTLNPLEPALHYCGANANYRCGRFSTIVAHGEAFTNSGRVFQPIRIGPAIFSGSQSRSFYCVSH